MTVDASGRNGDQQTIKFIVNGRSFVHRAKRYCEENGLQLVAAMDRAVIPAFAVSQIQVTGSSEQLREFVVWADQHYRKSGIADAFVGEPFMRGPDSQFELT
jgi:hypothetical protein